MKSVRRWLFHIFAGLSLVLCVAVVIQWVRSYWRWDHWSVTSYSTSFADGNTRMSGGRIMRPVAGQSSRQRSIDSANGAVQVLWDVARYQYGPGVDTADGAANKQAQELWASTKVIDPFMKDTPIAFMGFAYGYSERARVGDKTTGVTRMSVSLRTIKVPYWMPMVLLAIGPLWWLCWFGRRRPARGSVPCVNCGYDLRATPDRCPECGWIKTSTESRRID